jgi:hypothetical protein
VRATLALLVAVAVCLTTALAAAAGNGTPIDASANTLTVAVIGDTPYGQAEVEQFPALVDSINADPKVDLVEHLGDIKTGSSLCRDEYSTHIRALFDTFKDPLVYTPGDNEWTDCHRSAAGGYLPTERLAAVRATFFPEPGITLGGRKKQVLTQAVDGFVENTLWFESRVAFATVHVVGSNNDLAPWFGAAETPAQKTAQQAEFDSRLAADLAWIDRAFDVAEENDALGVVLGMQADMWDGVPANGFDAIVQRIATRAAAFDGPVLLLEGDSHRFKVDHPLAAGSPLHGVTTAAPNLTRIVVEGETASEWLRLTIDPRSPGVFSFERVHV